MLVVATVLATVGIAAAFTAGDDGAAERRLSDSVATLTLERDNALESIGRLDAELADAQEQLQAAIDSNQVLADRTADLDAQVRALTEQRAAAVVAAEVLTATIAELETTVDDLQVELGDSEARADVLEAAVQAANRRAVDAIAERDAIARRFPVSFDVSLVDAAMVGRFDADVSQVRCSGLASCGKAPAIKQLTISRTTEGWLWMKVPGLAEGGLSRAGGALQFVTTSQTAIPSCDGAQRNANVTMTLFPGSFRIADDGARSIAEVGAVITVQAPATGTCPAVLAMYSAELTPA